MIRLIALLLLIPSLCFGQVVASGSITAGNALCDLTTANAFCAPVGVDLSPYRGYTLKLYSGATLYAEGRISMTAPTGEALDSELIDTWTNNGTYPYETFTPGVGNLITQAVNSSSYGILYKNVTIANKLLKNTNAVTLNSGTNPAISITTNPSHGSPINFDLNATSYRTAPSNAANLDIYTGNGVATDFALTAYSTKIVTMPASTGALLLDAATGARGWTYKHASFTGNGAYTYEVISGGRMTLGQAVLAGPTTITAGNALMDTTTANAFGAPVGIDFGPYRTGKHMVKFTNTTGGYEAWAYISATAPSGLDYTDLIGGANPALRNGDFSAGDDGTWTKGAGWTIGSGVATIGTPANSNLTNAVTAVNGALYVSTADFTRSAGTFYFLFNDSYQAGLPVISSATYSIYRTSAFAGGTTHGISVSAAAVGTIDNFSSRRVTMPASTAALLCSDTAGTRGYISKHASFNPNAELTVTIYTGGTATLQR